MMEIIKNNRVLRLALVVLAVALVAAVYWLTVEMVQAPEAEIEIVNPGSEMVACTMDAKICPDGSAVGRSGPNCEFAACPGE